MELGVTFMKLNHIYNESCLVTLKRIKDNSINTVITSPPYNMNLRIRNGRYCSRQIVKELTTKYDDFDDNLDINEYNKFHSQVLSELLRVSGLVFYNIQLLTGNKRSVFKMIGDYSDYLKDIIIWDKGHAEPSIQAGVLNKRTEFILVFEKENSISRKFKTAQFKRGTLEDLWLIQRENNNLSSHKAIFPEKFVYKILSNFTNEKDIIYDPFIGTGSTAIVCKKMNRYFLGSEINENYVNVALQRLLTEKLEPFNIQNQSINQTTLF